VVVWDAAQRYFGVRITDKGALSFLVAKRMSGVRTPVVRVLGKYPGMKLVDARKQARGVLSQIADGIDPKKHKQAMQEDARQRHKNSFAAVAQEFIEKHASKNRRSKEAERVINLYLTSRFGQRQIGDIKRREIAELLDDIENGEFQDKKGRKLGGPVMADHVLAALRKLMNWHAARDDDFISPIVKGMARTKPIERARDRVLTDAEIRALWSALDADRADSPNRRMATGTFAGLVRALLLTAQRREEVARMERTELTADGIWTIPAERYKNKKPNVVPLSEAARAVIESMDRVNNSDLVFTTNGKTPYSGYSKAKSQLNAAMLVQLREAATERLELSAKVTLPPWRLHDLRRTAKTLMTRAGVRPDISERVLGHVIGGVQGVYDRHDYIAEKKDALEKLAAQLAKIISPPPSDNVVDLRSASKEVGRPA
jgi:integrase